MSEDPPRYGSEERTDLTLVTSAAIDFGLPVVAALSGWLPLVLVAASVRGGRAFAGAVKSKTLRAEVEGIRRMVDRVDRRVRRDLDFGPEDLRDLLQRPDILKLLAQARDDYAVAQMQPRLERLAAVVAGRASRENDDLDRDLKFARAAVEIPDEAVEFLATMVDRGEHDVKHRANQDPKTYRLLWGQVAMSEFLSRRPRRDQDDVTSAVAAVALAESHHLLMRGEERPPTSVGRPGPVAELRCVDGTTAYYPNEIWWPTAWGFEFVRLVRDADDSSGAAAAGSPR